MKILKKVMVTVILTMCIAAGVQTALSPFGSGVTVEAASRVKLNKTKLTLTKGKKFKLKLTGKKGKVKWSSSNKKIATVSSKGIVTAKKKGKVKITAKLKGKKYTCKVTVKNPVKTTQKNPVQGKTMQGEQIANGIRYMVSFSPQKIMAIKIYNGTNQTIKLGWPGKDFVATAITSTGNYRDVMNVLQSLQNTGNLKFDQIAPYTAETYTWDLTRITGTLKKVVFENIIPLNENGLPVFDWASFSSVAYSVAVNVK